MASSVLDLVQKLDRAAKDIGQVPTKGLTASLNAAKATMIAAGDAVNTPHQLSGRKKGNAWGVRYLWMTKSVEAEAVIFYYGAPPHWRESGIKAHTISPRKGHQAMLANGLYFTSAESPGVAARPFWQPTKATVMEQTVAVFNAATTEALIQAGFGR